MPTSNTAVFTQSCNIRQVQYANANAGTGNTARDGSNVSGSIAPGSNGSLRWYLLFQPITTVAAGILSIFYSPDNGTTKRLIGQIAYAANTPSSTVIATSYSFFPPGNMPFKPGNQQLFYFNFSNNTETWNMIVQDEDY